MKRTILVLSVVAGCDFAPGATPTADQPDAGSASTDGGAIAAACHVGDPTQLRLCLDFEGAVTPTAVDLSGGNHDATALAVQPMTRPGSVSQQAISMIRTSSIVVPESTDLDISAALSIEMWVARTTGQSSTSFPLQNRGQYEVSIDNSGVMSCAIGGDRLDAHSSLPLAWTHTACTYDGATLKLYINGELTECLDVQRSIPTNNTTGTGVGAKFVGGLDDVHVFARTLTAAEICTQAARVTCNQICPPRGG